MAIIIGTLKSETLTGTAFADSIFGKGGDDIVAALGGADRLDGGTGSDTLDGGAGKDKMTGGEGADVYIVDNAADQVIELADEGTDGVRSSLNSYTLGSNLENLAFIGSGAFKGTGNLRSNVITGGAGNDTLDGGDGNDRLSGRGGADTLSGGDGNDTLLGASARDKLFGGQGRDSLFGGLGDDRLAGESGNDLLDGGFARDMLSGGRGRDTLLGGAGSDTLIGGADDDTIDGGSAIDTARFSGFKDDYTVAIVNDKIEVVDQNLADGDDGTDLLTGIEILQFKDGTLPPPTIKGAIDLATLDGIKGFGLIGIDERDFSGVSVSSAGDVNGDGFDDVIVGAPGAESPGGATNEGESYVVFGKASWAGTPSLDLATLDGANGFRLIGIDADDASGRSVSSAGDVNGDGFADLIVGAYAAESAGGATNEGESYVVFGKASWTGSPALDLATLDGANGFRLIGIDAPDYSGASVSSAGDVNGDGFDDVIVGAPFAESTDGATDEGERYVVFGKASWAGTPSLDLATLDETNGFRLIGIDASDFGTEVSSAGDVNGDGFDDVIVGASNAESGTDNTYEGESYVVFGKASWVGAPSLDLATLDGTNGFSLHGINAGDLSGSSVSSAGDVNGDGFADLIVGANSAESQPGAYSAGESYVVFGKASWAGVPSLDLAALDGTNGFSLLGIGQNDHAGDSVSSAGDLNGDGFDDLIIGAPDAESPSGANYEGESYVVFGKASWAGTPSLDLATLDGKDGFRMTGIDEFDQSGQSVSSAGDVNGDGFADVIVGAADAESAGGASEEGESYVVFGGNFSSAAAHLGGAGDDTRTLSASDVLNLSDQSNEPLVAGDADDAVNRGQGWTAAASGGTNGNGTSTIDGELHQIYNAGQAKLLVDTDMTVSA